MRDYVQNLERELLRAARLYEERSPLKRTFSRAAANRRLPAATAIALVVSAVTVIALLSGGADPDRAAAFPVLKRTPIEAAGIRSRVPQLVDADAQFSEARAIETPFGKGYVVPAPESDQLCLAIPEQSSRGFGGVCESLAGARRQGIAVTLVPPADATSPRSEFVAVLPAGAPSPIVEHADSSVSRLPTVDGVAAGAFSDDVTVTLRIGATSRAIRVPLREPEGKQSADCGNGRIVPLPAKERYDQACKG